MSNQFETSDKLKRLDAEVMRLGAELRNVPARWGIDEGADGASVIVGRVNKPGGVSDSDADFPVDDIETVAAPAVADATITAINTKSWSFADNEIVLCFNNTDDDLWYAVKLGGDSVVIDSFRLTTNLAAFGGFADAELVDDDGVGTGAFIKAVDSQNQNFVGRGTYTNWLGNVEAGFRGYGIRFTDDYQDSGVPGYHIINLQSFRPTIMVELRESVSGSAGPINANPAGPNNPSYGATIHNRPPEGTDFGSGDWGVVVYNSSGIADEGAVNEIWEAAYKPETDGYELIQPSGNQPEGSIERFELDESLPFAQLDALAFVLDNAGARTAAKIYVVDAHGPIPGNRWYGLSEYAPYYDAGTTERGFRGTAVKFADDYKGGLPGYHILDMEYFIDMPVRLIAAVGDGWECQALYDRTDTLIQHFFNNPGGRVPQQSPGVEEIFALDGIDSNAVAGEEWIISFDVERDEYYLKTCIEQIKVSRGEPVQTSIAPKTAFDIDVTDKPNATIDGIDPPAQDGSDATALTVDNNLPMIELLADQAFTGKAYGRRNRLIDAADPVKQYDTRDLGNYHLFVRNFEAVANAQLLIDDRKQVAISEPVPDDYSATLNATNQTGRTIWEGSKVWVNERMDEVIASDSADFVYATKTGAGWTAWTAANKDFLPPSVSLTVADPAGILDCVEDGDVVMFSVKGTTAYAVGAKSPFCEFKGNVVDVQVISDITSVTLSEQTNSLVCTVNYNKRTVKVLEATAEVGDSKAGSVGTADCPTPTAAAAAQAPSAKQIVVELQEDLQAFIDARIREALQQERGE